MLPTETKEMSLLQSKQAVQDLMKGPLYHLVNEDCRHAVHLPNKVLRTDVA